jgi:hypothetical protein
MGQVRKLSSRVKGVSDALSRRLDLYVLAASAAGTGLLTFAQPAQGEIVYTPANQSIDANTHFNLDLNHDGVPDFQIWNEYSFRVAIEAKLGIKPLVAANRIAGNSEYAAALPGGVTIGGNERFPQKGDGIMVWWFYSFSSTICCGSYGPWRNVKDRYLGLKFLVDGQTHYGWARLNVSIKDANITAKLTGYAYETEAGKPIDAGQTTETGTNMPLIMPPVDSRRSRQVSALGLLAAGCEALPIWRRDNELQR